MTYLQQQKRFLTGDDLLSQGVSPQVPSALEGLTSWFGMEQGVSLPLESPEEPSLILTEDYLSFSTLKTEQNARDTFAVHVYELSPRPISTA